ncbi:unnamed protein product [Ectocarpus sp. CCAP 1310/34]|nr:unnamed protein product [Ectocarpus sp. CCAP 1310/34]
MQEARRLLENPRELHGLRNDALDHPRVYRGIRSAEDLDRHQLRNLVGAATLPDNGLVKILGFFLGDLRALESACAEAELQGPVEGSKFVGDRGVNAPVVHDLPATRLPGQLRSSWKQGLCLHAVGDRGHRGLVPIPLHLHAGCPQSFFVPGRPILDGRDVAGRLGHLPGRAGAGFGWEAEGVSSTGAAHQSKALRDAKALESAARGDLELHRACTNGGTVTDTRVVEMMLDFLGEAIEFHASANGGPTVNGIRRCDELEKARDQGLLQIRGVAGRVGREVRGKHVRARDDRAAGGNASWTGRSKGVNEEEAEAAKREAEAAHAPAPEEEKAQTAQAFGAATNRVEMARTAKKRRGTSGKIAAGVELVRTGILFVVHMLLLLFLVVDVDDVDDDDA